MKIRALLLLLCLSVVLSSLSPTAEAITNFPLVADPYINSDSACTDGEWQIGTSLPPGAFGYSCIDNLEGGAWHGSVNAVGASSLANTYLCQGSTHPRVTIDYVHCPSPAQTNPSRSPVNDWTGYIDYQRTDAVALAPNYVNFGIWTWFDYADDGFGNDGQCVPVPEYQIVVQTWRDSNGDQHPGWPPGPVCLRRIEYALLLDWYGLYEQIGDGFTGGDLLDIWPSGGDGVWDYYYMIKFSYNLHKHFADGYAGYIALGTNLESCCLSPSTVKDNPNWKAAWHGFFIESEGGHGAAVIRSFDFETQDPGPPTAAVVTAANSGPKGPPATCTITITPSPNIDFYKYAVWMKPLGGTYVLRGEFYFRDQTSFPFGGTPGTKYYWKVVTFDENLQSVASNEDKSCYFL